MWSSRRSRPATGPQLSPTFRTQSLRRELPAPKPSSAWTGRASCCSSPARGVRRRSKRADQSQQNRPERGAGWRTARLESLERSMMCCSPMSELQSANVYPVRITEPCRSMPTGMRQAPRITSSNFVRAWGGTTIKRKPPPPAPHSLPPSAPAESALS